MLTSYVHFGAVYIDVIHYCLVQIGIIILVLIIHISFCVTFIVIKQQTYFILSVGTLFEQLVIY